MVADRFTGKGKCSNSKSSIKFFNIIKEMLESGLILCIAKSAHTDPLYSSVDFSIDEDQFLKWFIDIVDCLGYFGWRLNSSIKNEKELIGVNGKMSSEFDIYRSYLSKIKICPRDSRLIFTYKKRKSVERKKNLPLDFNFTSGVVMQKFKPLDDDGQEEYEDGYGFDPDIEDYVEFDESKKVPDFIYTSLNEVNLMELRGIRGSAENLIIKTNNINISITKIFCKPKLFVPTGYNNLFEYINNVSNLIVFIPNSKYTKLEIPGYKEINHEDALRYMSQSDYISQDIVIKGKKLLKDDVVRSPALRLDISDVEGYFKSLSYKSQAEISNKIISVGNIVQDHGLIVNENFKKCKEKLEKILEEFNKKISKGDQDIETKAEDNENVNIDENNNNLKENDVVEMNEMGFNLSEVLNQIDLGEVGRDIISMNTISEEVMGVGKKNIAITQQKPRHMKFKDPIDLLTDPEVKAEIETIFPGYWNDIIAKNIFLTKKTKRMKIRTADLYIKCMPRYMKEKYQRLLLIVKAFLAILPETNDERKQDHRFSSMIDDLFYFEDDSDSDSDLSFGSLYPDYDQVQMEPEIDNFL